MGLRQNGSGGVGLARFFGVLRFAQDDGNDNGNGKSSGNSSDKSSGSGWCICAF